MDRDKILWTVIGLLASIPVAMYLLNPFNTASSDPRARILGFIPYRMPARSMEPTIHEGAIFSVNVATLRNRDPVTGEIVAFFAPRFPDAVFVQRVIASGGSTVEMRKGIVYVDGKLLPEPWLPAQPMTETEYDGERVQFDPEYIYSELAPTRVPPHHFFVLGDCRGNSDDSRGWGFLPRENVIGVYQK